MLHDSDELISIIMPAYNSDKYIAQAIDSVIQQTYQNWELIIIDDCSSDNTSGITEQKIEKDSRIRLIKNEQNLGVSATRNKGVALSRGEWVAFLDSDDLWEKSKLEKQMKLAQAAPAEFVFTGSSFIDENGDSYEGILEVPDKVTYSRLKRHNIISCSSVLIKKHFFDKIKMEKDHMHEDYAFWLKVLKTGAIAYGVNEPLLIYRISKTSRSGNKLKTIKKTYQVFRNVGINPVGSVYYMTSHVISSVFKYKRIGRVIG